jgi:cold shock CspA family protein
MARGKIKHIDCSKGYGFVIPDGSEPDNRDASLFFHKSKARDPTTGLNTFLDLATGDIVEFGVAQSERGDRTRLNAIDVRLAA